MQNVYAETIITKENLEKSLKELVENDVDLVYVNSKQIDGNEKVIHKDYFKYKNMPLISGKSKLAISRCIGIGCSQIFTKDVKEAMLPFTENVMAHDWLAAFIANENRGIAYIDTPLFDYRLHEKNVFGGRNLAQNTSRWKEKNGKTYKSYLKYRKEDVIDKAYLNGAKMCLDYCKIEKNKEFLNKISFETRIYFLFHPKIENITMLLDGTRPIKENFSNIIFTSQGYYFFFPPYQIAPYSAGSFEIFLKKSH